ncbi:hypothetical protein TNCV_1055101 [Trichonephila clavipes]|nr:hypothetical protein TNCV_1055101 [Trichonephila clavipes]
MDFTEINSMGEAGRVIGRIGRQNSRFRTAKTSIIKFGLHAFFVELESAKSALNESSKVRSLQIHSGSHKNTSDAEKKSPPSVLSGGTIRLLFDHPSFIYVGDLQPPSAKPISVEDQMVQGYPRNVQVTVGPLCNEVAKSPKKKFVVWKIRYIGIIFQFSL